MLTDDQIKNILKYGKQYRAVDRYYTGNVMCDYCMKTIVDNCIGYQQYDICLNCRDRLVRNSDKGTNNLSDITSRTNNTRVLTRMVQDSCVKLSEDIECVTFMVQDACVRNPNNDTRYLTYMAQDACARIPNNDTRYLTYMAQDAGVNKNQTIFPMTTDDNGPYAKWNQ